MKSQSVIKDLLVGENTAAGLGIIHFFIIYDFVALTTKAAGLSRAPQRAQRLLD
jgi:hypothetical protein